MPKMRASVRIASRTSLRSPRAHGAMAPPRSDFDSSGHDQMRVEVIRRAKALAIRTRAVRRVERKGPRRHFGHRDAACHARKATRKQLVATLVCVDDHDVVGEVQRELEGVGQTALDARPDDQPIDDRLDRVVPSAIELDVLLERAELAVNPGLREAALPQRLQLLLELPFSSPHDWRKHVDARVLRIEHDEVEDALERLRRDLAATAVAVRNADVGKQQPQVVVDLGHRADGRPGIGSRCLLLDGNGGRQTFDQIDVRLLHLLEKLSSIGGQRFDVPALSLRIDGVERQR